MQIALVTFMSRSGSTFFSSLLDEYQSFHVTIETDFFKQLSTVSPDALGSPASLADRFEHSHLANNLFQRDRFLALAADLPVLTHQNVASCVLQAYFETEVTGAVLVKSRGPAWYLSAIAERMPELKFVHVVRDGRAVLNSQYNTRRVYKRGNMACEPLMPARIWRNWTSYVDRFRERFPGRILEIRFEDAVAEPEVTAARVQKFLIGDTVLVGKDGTGVEYRDKIPERELSLHENVGQSPIAGNVDKWKQSLPQNDVVLFELIAGRALANKGYVPLYVTGSRFGWLVRPRVLWRLATSLLRFGLRRMENAFYHLYRVASGKPLGSSGQDDSE
ncbi:MAG: sulfotransferase [Proteobacteria bacterium]|nr:sulfotransferase [Pseudomonadota bacterium]MBU1611637.1 sulfotransferase [Pseudomonadota bacterium]